MKAWLFGLAALLALCSCTTPERGDVTPPTKTTKARIAELNADDSVEAVTKKLGRPSHIPYGTPWLIYYAEDEIGLYYRITFKLREPQKLHRDDVVDRVTLTDGLFDPADSIVVWPDSAAAVSRREHEARLQSQREAEEKRRFM